jgi:BASS family bile acid:Na+ symporter
MTPLLMKLLAGTLVEVRFINMMLEIIKIVLVPIGAALLHDYLKHASVRGRRVALTLAGAGTVWMLFLALGGWGWIKANVQESGVSVISILDFFLGAVVVGVVYHWLTRWLPWLDARMPVFSMAGIVYFTTVTTAAGRHNLLQVGALLFLASAMHNAAGYCFGYWLSRGAGLDKNSARSVAFEVGLQNGGMASGIAGALNKLGTMGLAAAVFSPWMNVSGSMLANYWRKRPAEEKSEGRRPKAERSLKAETRTEAML